jgi:hypothetical protein
MAQSDLLTPPTLRYAAAKPKMTIYFALLIIALVATLIACLVMFLEIKRFGGFGAVKGTAAVERKGQPIIAIASLPEVTIA